jgi:hypothetical protein
LRGDVCGRRRDEFACAKGEDGNVENKRIRAQLSFSID